MSVREWCDTHLVMRWALQTVWPILPWCVGHSHHQMPGTSLVELDTTYVYNINMSDKWNALSKIWVKLLQLDQFVKAVGYDIWQTSNTIKVKSFPFYSKCLCEGNRAFLDWLLWFWSIFSLFYVHVLCRNNLHFLNIHQLISCLGKH